MYQLSVKLCENYIIQCRNIEEQIEKNMEKLPQHIMKWEVVELGHG